MAEDKNEISRIYVKSDVIAQIFDLSVRRVQQLTQEGIISTEIPESGKARKYNLQNTCHAYIRYLKGIANGKIDRESELKTKKLEAEIALKESQGELHQLKTEIAMGKYVTLEEIQMDYKKYFVILKKFVTSISNRVSGLLSENVDPTEGRRIEKLIDSEMKDVLNTFIDKAITPEEKKAKTAKKQMKGRKK